MLAFVTKSLVDMRASGIVRSGLWLYVLGIPLGFLFHPLCTCQFHSQFGFSYGNNIAATILVIMSECPLHRERETFSSPHCGFVVLALFSHVMFMP